jgi:mono/diheme cytochrome c family protein
MTRCVSAALAVVMLVVAALALRLSTARADAQRDVEAGRALYTRDCATCHGSTGRGDGPSAAGFATKPADLTEGRLMNGLPDQFLANVILTGGPAEGLSLGMPPFRGHLSEDQVRRVIAYVRTLARPAFRAELAPTLVVPPRAPTQPIFFSHLVHAGSFQIPCQYCHADARRSEYAGLPSVERCMGCHKIIGAQDNPEIAKIHAYWQRKEPIPWIRVFKVPEFTYFPHKPHIRAGLACQRCHGPVERMRVVGADTGRNLKNDLLNLIGVHPEAPPLSMGWCIDCHRTENRARGTHAPLDCATCHH